MRAIVRFSLDGEKNNKLGNQLRSILEGYYFVKHVSQTSTYENPDITPFLLNKAMIAFWNQATSRTNVASIDHVWMYCDKSLPTS